MSFPRLQVGDLIRWRVLQLDSPRPIEHLAFILHFDPVRKGYEVLLLEFGRAKIADISEKILDLWSQNGKICIQCFRDGEVIFAGKGA